MVGLRRFVHAALLLAVLPAAGCGEADRHTADVTASPAPAPAPGLWQGTFPCTDCPGIDVTLWLRPDGGFFLRQHYLADDGDERYYALGRWVWDEEQAVLRLRGSGPERWFERTTDGRLAMQVPSDLPHRLERRGDLVPFTDTVTVEGEYEGAGRRFRECRSGLAWPVARAGDYRRLVHQYGRVPRGELALLTIRGRLEPTDDGETLVIEELVQLKPGRGCP